MAGCASAAFHGERSEVLLLQLGLRRFDGVFRSGRRSSSSRVKFDDGSDELVNLVLFRERDGSFERNPCSCNAKAAFCQLGSIKESEQTRRLTLALAITTLNLLMNTFLHLALQNPSSLRLVKVGHFEQLSRVQPSIILPSHHQLLADDKLIHRSTSSSYQSLVSVC